MKDRKKLLSVRTCNPDIDLRLWFERSSNKLSSIAKTTYGEWATKNGFKWYDNETIYILIAELALLMDNKKYARNKSKKIKTAI